MAGKHRRLEAVLPLAINIHRFRSLGTERRSAAQDECDNHIHRLFHNMKAVHKIRSHEALTSCDIKKRLFRYFRINRYFCVSLDKKENEYGTAARI